MSQAARSDVALQRALLLSRRSLALMSLLCVAPSAAVSATPVTVSEPSPQEEVLELWIGEGASQCPKSLSLAPDRQLMLELPEEAQVAAPTRQGVLRVHIAPQLVVIEPLNPNRWRDAPPVGLSVVLAGGGRIYCSFAPPAEGAEPPRVSIVRFRVTEPALKARREALSLLKEAGELSEQGDVDGPLALQEISRSLKELSVAGQERLNLRALSTQALELSRLPPVRAQEGLIYLTLTQRFSLGDRLWVRASLHNRSQPRFELQSLTLTPHGGQPLELNYEPREIIAPPDGRARFLAFSLPLRVLKSAERPPTLTLNSRDGRSLSLTLPREP